MAFKAVAFYQLPCNRRFGVKKKIFVKVSLFPVAAETPLQSFNGTIHPATPSKTGSFSSDASLAFPTSSIYDLLAHLWGKKQPTHPRFFLLLAR